MEVKMAKVFLAETEILWIMLMGFACAVDVRVVCGQLSAVRIQGHSSWEERREALKREG